VYFPNRNGSPTLWQGGQLVDSISVPLYGSSPSLNVIINHINTSDFGVYLNSVIVYDISYANFGDREATGVEVHMTVPEYTTFTAEGSSVDWDCANGSVVAGTECTFQIETLAAGDRGEEYLIFVVRLDRDIDPCSHPYSDVRQIDAEVSILDDGLNGPSAGGQQVDSISLPIIFPHCPRPESTPRPTPKAGKSYLPVINQ